MNAEVRDGLAQYFCAARYDCPQDAGWATSCDHGFGYRDTDELLASGCIDVALASERRRIAELLVRVMDEAEVDELNPLDRGVIVGYLARVNRAGLGGGA